MSYPVSSLAHHMHWKPSDYKVDTPMIPHGSTCASLIGALKLTNHSALSVRRDARSCCVPLHCSIKSWASQVLCKRCVSLVILLIRLSPLYRQVAELLGADVTNIRDTDAGMFRHKIERWISVLTTYRHQGPVLADEIIKLMQRLKIPNGLQALGFKSSDVDALVQGALPQHRVLKLAPIPTGQEELAKLFQESMRIW